MATKRRETPFTDLLNSFDDQGETSDDAWNQAYDAMRRWTSRELARRGLLHRPPRLLDVVGPSWTAPRGQGEDALDELTHDCFGEIFGKLAKLLEYRDRGWDVEQVVSRMLRNVLNRRQRRTDRLGFDVYSWLCEALEQAVDDGTLDVLRDGERPFGNTTVFSFPDAEASDTALAEFGALDAWIDDLLGDWLTARGPRVRLQAAALTPRIAELAADAPVFTFKALVDALKQALRQRLAALWPGDELPAALSGDGEGDSTAGADGGVGRILERDAFDAVSRCVEQAVKTARDKPATRDYLLRLWHFMEVFVLVAADHEPGRAGKLFADLLDGERFPSDRALQEHLGIPRDRISGLKTRLRDEAQRCRQKIGTARATDNLDDQSETYGSEANVDHERGRHELRLQVAAAYRQARREQDAPTSGVLEPGHVFHLEPTPEPGVEWVLLEVDELDEKLGLVVPADALGWVGSADTTADTSAGRLSLHADRGTWLPLDVLRELKATARIHDDDLERARERRRLVFGGTLRANDEANNGTTDEEYETDADPDYRAWRRTLDDVRASVAQELDGTLDDGKTPARPQEDDTGVVTVPRRRIKPLRLLPLAASLPVAFVAGWLFSASQHVPDERLDTLEAAIQDAENARRQAEDARAAAEQRLAAEQQRADEDREALRAQLRGEMDAREQNLVERLTGVGTWEVVPRGRQRGSANPLPVPEDAGLVSFLIAVEGEGRVEIRTLDGDVIHAQPVVETTVGKEVLVNVLAELLPPAIYEVVVWEKDGDVETEVARQRYQVVRP